MFTITSVLPQLPLPRAPSQDPDSPSSPQDLLPTLATSRGYYRPWRQLARNSNDVGSTMQSDTEKFEINLDVKLFTPEEISVKIVDGWVVVEGKHEEKMDKHGLIFREFTRKYALPEKCNPYSVMSRLADGVLSIVAPILKSQTSNECTEPITEPETIKTNE